MILKDTSQIKTSVVSLISIGKKNNLISSLEAEYYSKLSNSEPVIIFGLLCEKFYSLGAAKLFKQQGEVMNTLNVCYPSFSNFIRRATLSKPVNMGVRRLAFITSQITYLAEIALEYKLITEQEMEMYKDLLSWSWDNCIDVEKDILLKVNDWDYTKFKKDAPKILEYIQNFYPDWFGVIIAPYEKEVKARISKN